MKYYFVERIGRIVTDEAPKGWFTKEVHQNMFTNKKDAISAEVSSSTCFYKNTSFYASESLI